MSPRGVALIGFMAAGKSTVGPPLAVALHLPFVDMDAVLAARHGPIAEQFARDGESAFRAREQALCAELADTGPAVIATGGGAWGHSPSRAALRRGHVAVWIDVPLEVALARIGASEGRPLASRAIALYADRVPLYAQSDLRVDGTDRTDHIVARILQEGHCHGWW